QQDHADENAATPPEMSQLIHSSHNSTTPLRFVFRVLSFQFQPIGACLGLHLERYIQLERTAHHVHHQIAHLVDFLPGRFEQQFIVHLEQEPCPIARL